MNFFEHKEKARKKTFVLVLYFVLAIVLILLAIDGVIVSALLIAHQDSNFITYNGSQAITSGMVIFLLIITGLISSPIVLLVIFLGTLFKLISLRKGGISVAEMVASTPIDPNTSDFLEKRFINIV